MSIISRTRLTGFMDVRVEVIEFRSMDDSGCWEEWMEWKSNNTDMLHLGSESSSTNKASKKFPDGYYWVRIYTVKHSDMQKLQLKESK